MSQAGILVLANEPGVVGFLEGNSGGQVSPDGSNTIFILGSGGVTVAGNAGAHSLTISLAGTVSSWTDVTTTSQQMAVNNGYTSDNAGLVTLTLPSVVNSTYGSMVAVVGKGAGGWKIAQNALQSIVFSSITTTAGVTGFLASTVNTDVVFLLCTTTGTVWTVVDSIGNISWN